MEKCLALILQEKHKLIIGTYFRHNLSKKKYLVNSIQTELNTANTFEVRVGYSLENVSSIQFYEELEYFLGCNSRMQ
jgi:hypothetical protein